MAAGTCTLLSNCLLCALLQAETAYQASQHTVEYWRDTWSKQPPSIPWHAAPKAAGSTGSGAGSSAPLSSQQQHQPPAERIWRVLFQTRTEAVRQFTNLQHLLDRCSTWQYTDAATGWVHRALCGVWPATSAPEVIAGGLPRAGTPDVAGCKLCSGPTWGRCNRRESAHKCALPSSNVRSRPGG